jgi:hypothetical protein
MISAVNELMQGLSDTAAPLSHPAAPLRLKQAAMKGALGHVYAFFRKFGDIEETGLNLPLKMLLTALADLEGGTQPALLRPRRARHAPSMSVAKQTLAFHAAHTLDQLMEFGLSREAGAQEVARQIELAGISLTDRKPVTAKRVADWRDQLSAGPGAMPGFVVEIWRGLPARKRSDGSLRPVPGADQIVLKNFRRILDLLAANLKNPPS